MTTARILTTALVGAAFIGLAQPAALLGQEQAKGGLTVAEFEKLHKELQPPGDELWRTIPWHVSILEGREAAARAGKPIFVWVASGEPLGCG
jgi:hypothetical protein